MLYKINQQQKYVSYNYRHLIVLNAGIVKNTLKV